MMEQDHVRFKKNDEDKFKCASLESILHVISRGSRGIHAAWRPEIPRGLTLSRHWTDGGIDLTNFRPSPSQTLDASPNQFISPRGYTIYSGLHMVAYNYGSSKEIMKLPQHEVCERKWQDLSTTGKSDCSQCERPPASRFVSGRQEGRKGRGR